MCQCNLYFKIQKVISLNLTLVSLEKYHKNKEVFTKLVILYKLPQGQNQCQSPVPLIAWILGYSFVLFSITGFLWILPELVKPYQKLAPEDDRLVIKEVHVPKFQLRINYISLPILAPFTKLLIAQ